MSEVTGERRDTEPDQPTISTIPESTVTNTSYGSPNRVVWAIALILSAGLAVTAINIVQPVFALPLEYDAVDITSSPELQAAASIAIFRKDWKNALLIYGIAGLCLGLPSLVTSRRNGMVGVIGSVASSLLFGALCGMIAVSLAMIIIQRMRADGYDFESMAPELVAWTVMSAVLALPAAYSLFVGGEKLFSQKMMSIPLAGILTGIVVTIGVSLYMPNANTSKLPPSGLALTAVWFTILIALVLFLTLSTGSRKPKLAPTN